MSKIVNISEAASIALHAMVLIAKAQGMINVVKIAEKTESSKHHVAKVMQRLVKDNYVNSLRGPNGGFILKKKPEEISLLEIYESIEGKIVLQECPANKQVCPIDKCFYANLINQLSIEFRNFLQKNTLDKYM
jgi:Rrf2 family protein